MPLLENRIDYWGEVLPKDVAYQQAKWEVWGNYALDIPERI